MGFFTVECRGCGARVRRSAAACSDCSAISPAMSGAVLLAESGSSRQAFTSRSRSLVNRLIGWAFLLGLVIAAFSLLTRQDTPEEATAKANAQRWAGEVAQRAVAQTKRVNRSRVEVWQATPTNFQMALIYGDVPSGYGVIESDAKAVIRTILAELLKSSDMKQRSVSILVFVKGTLVGETGTPLVQSLGLASYNSNTDQIIFERK
jgi:hypothetical protein